MVRTADGVEVTLADGRVVEGSHCLIAVGSVPDTHGRRARGGRRGVASPRPHRGRQGLAHHGRGVYAAGDCTGVLPLASVAAMQGRLAMAHALGDAVTPIDCARCRRTSSRAPEIATVGAERERTQVAGIYYQVIIACPWRATRAPRCSACATGSSRSSPTRWGRSVVWAPSSSAPRASEPIFPLTLAVTYRLTIDDIAETVHGLPVVLGDDRRGRATPAQHDGRRQGPLGEQRLAHVLAGADSARHREDRRALGLEVLERQRPTSTAGSAPGRTGRGGRARRRGRTARR